MRLSLLLAALALPFAAPVGAALAPGAKAPDFRTQGALNGKVFNLTLSDQLTNGPVVLYFFPAAFTPGCNAEAKAFADATAQFKAAGATVIGMSADPVNRLVAFSTEHCAGKFAVASAGPKVVSGYDVALAGRKMTSRTSYVIARDGRIVYAHDDPSPAGHITGTLAAVKKLARS
ncbi:peroxiredoxin [Sphingomonas japonica]|uniref:thioredoxin-dependent peroxiredoxin n=1 Tax=Sphingomonas japonica TaxID=511662 RepID=A0ABX0TYU9_9SPHN|nr:peroxiredoxin [Sphingomonas japonica]NIJ23398.1 peroxiredoxin [Sphingomonas japonica]